MTSSYKAVYPYERVAFVLPVMAADMLYEAANQPKKYRLQAIAEAADAIRGKYPDFFRTESEFKRQPKTCNEHFIRVGKCECGLEKCVCPRPWIKKEF